MIAIARVLCPVDSSEFSRRALKHAVAFAGWYGAEVTALSVRPRLLPSALWSEYPGPIPVEGPAERDEAEARVRGFVREATGTDNVTTVITEGPVVPEILKAAAELPADLVVMGTHGATGFDRLLLGSVTEKVLRKAPCPVLTVPRHVADAEPQHVSFKRIVCAIDFSEESLRGLEFALSLAQETDGTIALVHSLEGLGDEELSRVEHFDVPEFRRMQEADARRQLEQLIPADARSWCQPQIVLGHGKAYREILRVADETNAELIVLGVRGRGAVSTTIFGSTTQHVLRGACCPVLTVSVPVS